MASREIHFRDEIFEELFHNAKPVEEVPSDDDQTLPGRRRFGHLIPANYRNRMEKIGNAMFSSNAGQKWLMTAFRDIIRSNVAINKDVTSVPERVSRVIYDIRKEVERETSMFTARLLKWVLRIRSLAMFILNTAETVQGVADTISIAYHPQLTPTEHLVLAFISPGERERVWEMVKVQHGGDFTKILNDIASAIMAGVVPTVVSCAKEVFWKSIDALLSMLQGIGAIAKGIAVARWAIKGGAGAVQAAVKGVRAAKAASVMGKVKAIEQSGEGFIGTIQALYKIRGLNTVLKISDAAGNMRALRIAYNENKRLQSLGSVLNQAGTALPAVEDLSAMRNRIVGLFQTSFGKGKEEGEESFFGDYDAVQILENMKKVEWSPLASSNPLDVRISPENFNTLLVSFFVETSTPPMSLFTGFMEVKAKTAPVFIGLFGESGVLDRLRQRMEKTVKNAVRAREQLHGETVKRRFFKYAFTWSAEKGATGERHLTTGIRMEFANGDERRELTLEPAKPGSKPTLDHHTTRDVKGVLSLLLAIGDICNAAIGKAVPQ